MAACSNVRIVCTANGDIACTAGTPVPPSLATACAAGDKVIDDGTNVPGFGWIGLGWLLLMFSV